MSVQTLYTAATGMSAMEDKLDTIANNLANINTTAFKSGRLNSAIAGSVNGVKSAGRGNSNCPSPSQWRRKRPGRRQSRRSSADR